MSDRQREIECSSDIDLAGHPDSSVVRFDDVFRQDQAEAGSFDILVDLNGYTKDARAKVVAQKPAPVIVNWFGFPGSMGKPRGRR